MMVRISCLCVLTLLAYNVSAQDLVIKHLTGDYYVYTTFSNYQGTKYPSNSMYLVTSEGVVLFDTPWDSTQFQPLLDSIERRHHMKVVLCIATHFHADRTAGLEYFRSMNIKTFTSKETFQLAKARKEKVPEFQFTKDTVFQVGSHQIETFYPGKGHTSDNIVIWFEEERILYGGCLVKSTETNSMGNVADASVTDWAGSIRKIMTKYPNRKFVIPGHLDWRDPNALEHTLKLVTTSNKKD